MKRSKYRNWDEKQITFLLENYGRVSVEKIAKKLNKPIGSIYYILKKENIDVEIQCWNITEITLLKELYPQHSNQELEKLFVRSEDAIQLKAASLGLKKSSWWSDNDIELLKEMILEQLSYTKMAQVLGRTRSSVHNKLIAEGLTDECRRWTNEEIQKIQELANSGNYTYLDIAMALNATPKQIQVACKYYKCRNKIKRTISYGNDKMMSLLKKMFPHYTIKQEYHIGEKLRLDAYIKELNIGFEYDGIQHFRYTPQWHCSKAGFIRAQERDDRKNILCIRQRITLIRVKYNEDLTEVLLWNKLQAYSKDIKEEKLVTIQAKPKAKIQSKGFQKPQKDYQWPTKKIQSRKFQKKQ